MRWRSSEWSSTGGRVSQPEPVTTLGEGGAVFAQEIREQPAALRRLADREAEIAEIAEAVRERGRTLVRIVGHGSSDNAASYGVYAFGLLPGITATRDSISLSVNYRTEIDMTGQTAIGLSQSGRTPDVVEYLARAKHSGAFTIAVTNDAGSELATVADAVIDLSAGPERAVAATKTYTNTIGALALLAGHIAGDGRAISDGLRRTADLLEGELPAFERAATALALPFAYIGRMFVIGRGVEFATAREVALKLLETCYVAAEPLTATDLAHGPIAALDPFFPVWAIASHDETLGAVQEAAARTSAAGATLVASGTAAAEIAEAAYRLPVPTPEPLLLSPLLSVVPGQLFARALARAKGLDPDAPRGLAKITLAR